MRGLNSKLLFTFVSCFVSSQVYANPINIFCYYLVGDKSESVLLLDAEKRPVQIEGAFDGSLKAYIVSSQDLAQADLACRGAASALQNYDHIKGASTLSGSLHQLHLGFLTSHFLLIAERSLPVEMVAARDVFAHLGDMHFEEHPLIDDSTQLLAKFKVSNLDPIVALSPLAPYLEHTFLVDFNRSNFVLLLGHELLYGHKENLTWDSTQSRYVDVLPSVEQRIEQLFTNIESAASHSAALSALNPIQLRKNIALALATRSQAFEAVPFNRVMHALVEQAASRGIMMNAHGYGRLDNILTVEGSTLVLESNSGIKVELIKDGTWDVGLYLCHREMRVNLLTGEMTPEAVTLTQVTFI